MDSQLCEKIEDEIEQLKENLFQNASNWQKIQTPVEMFVFEKELEKMLQKFHCKMVGTILEGVHQDKTFVAECQTQMRLSGSRNAGWREIPVRSLGGQEISLRTPYRRKRSEKKVLGKRGKGGNGDYPILRRLGIVGRATPALLALINRQVADGPSEEEVQERLAERNIVLDIETIRRYVRDFACIALWQRKWAIHHLDEAKILEPTYLTGKRVVIGIDGGRIRMRINKEHKETTVPWPCFSTDKCESKLFVIYTIDEQGRKESEGKILYDGTVLPAQSFFALLKLRLKQWGIEKAELVEIIGDGSDWIWTGSAELQAHFFPKGMRVVEVVDWAHAVGKLTLPTKLGIKDSSQRKKWLKQMRKLLKKGTINEMITLLSELDQSHDEEEVIRKTIEYFQTHQKRMQYAQLRAENLSIGSGVIESGIRRIVNLRMKGTSIFWKPEKAESILYLRCQIKSKNWIPFVMDTLSQWATKPIITFLEALQIRDQIIADFLKSHPPRYKVKPRKEAIQWVRDLFKDGSSLLIDTETTGLSDKDEIIQLAIVDLQNHVLFKTFVKPTMPVSCGARAVHGISDTVLANAPTFPELYETIINLISNRRLIAYNAPFDQRLLGQTCEKYGLLEPEGTTWDCVMEQYVSFEEDTYHTGDPRWQSLSAACAQQDIPIQRTHDAVEDCLLTWQLIKKMAEADKDF